VLLTDTTYATWLSLPSDDDLQFPEHAFTLFATQILRSGIVANEDDFTLPLVIVPPSSAEARSDS
jgi:hypothetical protein